MGDAIFLHLPSCAQHIRRPERRGQIGEEANTLGKVFKRLQAGRQLTALFAVQPVDRGSTPDRGIFRNHLTRQESGRKLRLEMSEPELDAGTGPRREHHTVVQIPNYVLTSLRCSWNEQHHSHAVTGSWADRILREKAT